MTGATSGRVRRKPLSPDSAYSELHHADVPSSAPSLAYRESDVKKNYTVSASVSLLGRYMWSLHVLPMLGRFPLGITISFHNLKPLG